MMTYGFVDSAKLLFKHVLDFKGRSCRAEFWWAYLFVFLTQIAAGLIIAIAEAAKLPAILSLLLSFGSIALSVFLFVAQVSLAFRRLHDVGRSAWYKLWVVLAAISVLIIGSLVLSMTGDGAKLIVIPLMVVLALVPSCVLLYWYGKKGQVGPNKYGADPLQGNYY